MSEMIGYEWEDYINIIC